MQYPLTAWPQAEFSPQAPYATWAQQLLGLDTANGTLTGTGIRVAVADSGCDTTHPMARGFSHGMNYTDADPGNWSRDLIGHGTWCETLIAGDDANGHHGIAPGCEMHTLRIFPGGKLSDLQRALTYCIDNAIDVLSLSLGTPDVDQGTAAFLQGALSSGVAIFVAAGNSYGPIAFPASQPGAFAVAAIGQRDRFPPNTYHEQTRVNQTRAGAVGINGLFAPDFTAAGPGIQGCAPGVGVISGVPGGGYKADDGTSMACPGMAGVAALALAHHPAIQGQRRSLARTQALYRVLRECSQQTGLDPSFSGAGYPSVAGFLPAQPSLGDLIQGLLAQTARRNSNSVARLSG